MPTAPSNLAASRGGIGEIALAWTNTETYETVEVYRSATPGSVVDDYELAEVVDGTTEAYTDTDRRDGERLYYRVAGVTNGTRSTLSNEADTVTRLPTPMDLAAAPGSTSIDVSWTTNHDAGWTRVEYRPSDVDTWTQGPTVDVDDDSTATLTGLRTGEEYKVRALAITEHLERVDGTLYVLAGETEPVVNDDSTEFYAQIVWEETGQLVIEDAATIGLTEI
ncbi:fibronectin type III domain-containing protein [Halorubellus sp. JP-L1]|uniref:fibronectin type III domain-containing protein n=1 Tax=Halorubellus sp. JP-L1 TaxID=2715753 RepID=UPI00140B3A3F|nr:fibronectin type III domain-containing protein [Halorubellus sp. JP-L1]NHN40534.1 fibronectin type III domain-containing protein [Halorubellus sp. JP-L1]